jgi:hypothetical protein
MKVRIKREVFVLGLAFLLSACSEKAVVPGAPVIRKDYDEARVILGPRTTAVIGNPTQVDGFRIVSPLSREFDAMKKARPSVGEYPILEQVSVPLDVAAMAANTLLTPGTYDPKFMRDCNFDPGYVLRFRRGTSTVQVVICFKCDDVEITPSPDLGETAGTLPAGGGDSGLYDAIMKVFPKQKTAAELRAPADWNRRTGMVGATVARAVPAAER